LTESDGVAWWTSSVAGSRAKTSLPPASVKESQASEADSGRNFTESFAKYDRDSSSWKMSQDFLFEEWAGYWETWPKQGMMRDGIAYQPPMSERHISESEFGLWRAPTAQEAGARIETLETKTGEPAKVGERAYRNTPSGEKVLQSVTLGQQVKMWPTPKASDGEWGTPRTSGRPISKVTHLQTAAKYWPTPSASSRDGTVSGGHPGLAGGSGNRQKLYKMLGKEEGKKMGCQSLNPYWVEWLMGWPLGWTVLDAAATAWFRSKRCKRGRKS